MSDRYGVDKAAGLTSLKRPLQSQWPCVAEGADERVHSGARSTAGYYINYFSSRIPGVGAFGLPDVVQDGLAKIDFVYEYRLKGDDRWKLRFSV